MIKKLWSMLVKRWKATGLRTHWDKKAQTFEIHIQINNRELIGAEEIRKTSRLI